MTKFTYNNAKNASTGHTPFELNCGYHLWMSYKDNVDPCSKSKSANKLSAKLRKLMIVCRENLYHAQDSKSKPTIKSSSLGAIPLAIKFG